MVDVESKIAAIKSFAAEIVTEDELRRVFETNDHPVAYDGFEPSGLAPIHFGLLRAKNLKVMLDIGIKFNLYLADYFALINNKMGGDLDKIRDVGRYFVEVWRGAGIDTSKVKVVWSKDLMSDLKYWDMFIRVGKVLTLDRVKRAVTIMGRKEGEAQDTASLFYPCMQVTDIFQMDIDICQLGMDQRKANILAREVAQKYKWKTPVAVHHGYLLGLRGAPKDLKTMSDAEGMAYKMSKSDPSSSILVHDTKEEIMKKVNSAYCPEKIIEGNPMFDYLDKIIVDDRASPITIDRPQKFGGPIEASDFAGLKGLYIAGKIHPTDLKGFVAEELEKRIRPVREHFERDKKAKELYDKVRSYQITR